MGELIVIRINCENGSEKSSRVHQSRFNTIRRSSNRKELSWIKTKSEKEVDKVLLREILIMIRLNDKALTHVNSQQICLNLICFLVTLV